jgi:hypothetical protein
MTYSIEVEQEEDAAGSPRFLACPESSHTERLPRKLAHGSRPWHCESSPTVSSTAKRTRISSRRYRSLQRE